MSGGTQVEGSDLLQTTAEVAIALTGFTGIVVALSGRSGPLLSGFGLLRFKILLIASLAALAFSFLPLFLHHLGASANTAWALSSALAIAFLVPIAIADARSYRAFADEIPTFERRAAPVIGLLGLALLITQVMNVLFVRSFGPYLAVPLWFVGFSALSFSRLLFTLQGKSDE